MLSVVCSDSIYFEALLNVSLGSEIQLCFHMRVLKDVYKRFVIL